MKSRSCIWTTALLVWILAVSICAVAGTPQWRLLSTGPPFASQPEARGFHGSTIVYSPLSNRLILFGGRPSTIINFNDVWVLTNANGLGGEPDWSNVIPNGAPGSPTARSGHSAVYDVADDRMIVFGGCSGYCLPVLNDVWVLRNASGVGGNPTWIQLSPTGGPPAPRTRAVAVYDPNNNRMIIFAGQNGSGSGGFYSDVWVLTNANGLGGTPTWIQLSPSGTPAAGRYGASGVYDSVNNILTVFGGGVITGGGTNGVWTLSNANGLGGTSAWNQVSISGNQPAARGFHTAVYDPASNRMTIFGGTNGHQLSDVWVLINANGIGSPSWVQIQTGIGFSSPSPIGRESHSAAYDPINNVMMLFGGDNADGWFRGPWVLTDANGL